MREIMLIIHFIGLAMGLGTSFGFMFLGIAASKMPKEEAVKFGLNTFALGRMGQIGLALLVISGLYLMTPFWKILTTQPLLIAKLCMVVLLIIMIVIIGIYTKKAKTEDAASNMKKLQPLGKLSLVTAIIIVILAVLNFH